MKLQKEVIASGLKLLVILEGRYAAGKDVTIKRIIKHLSPRETIVVALGKPTDFQERRWYFQRYCTHLPVSGEFVLFNRSSYNRLGVEKTNKAVREYTENYYLSAADNYKKRAAEKGAAGMKLHRLYCSKL